MNASMQHTHFSVAPGFLEQHARALMLEDNWRGALGFLATTLSGLPADITLGTAVAILKGELSLEADGELVRTRPQDPADPALQRFLNTQSWQQAGLWHVDGGFYQPYARIAQWGQDDAKYAAEHMQLFEDRDFTPQEYRELRARFYCERRESDRIFFDDKLGAVLFKRVPDPAFWLPVFKEAPAALERFVVLRRLETVESSMPETNPLASDPRHWRFYAPALHLALLRPPYDADGVLSAASRATLGPLIEKQDELRNARWAPEGSEERDSVERLEEELSIAMLRAQIVEQAATQGGFLPLTLHDHDGSPQVVQVPAAPLLRWASRNLSRVDSEALPAWKVVCSQGMKMAGDNPMHTDWWVGAGFEPRAAYWSEHPLNKAAWNFALTLSHTRNCDFVKLAGKGQVFGRVVFPGPNEEVSPGDIAVVPAASPDYQAALLTACVGGRGAVISAVGGKLAHLATVARETNSRIVVVNDAMTAFQAGEFVSLDLDKGTLRRHQTVLQRHSDDQEDLTD